MRGLILWGLLIFQLFIISRGIDNNLIEDYFLYKRVTSVLGFSCGNAKNDFDLTMKFSDIHKFLTVLAPNTVLSGKINTDVLLDADYHPLGVFLDLRCYDHKDTILFLQTTGKDLYDEMHKWLIFTSDIQESLQYLNDSKFSVSTDVILAVKIATGYKLYDVYNPCKLCGGELNMTYLGRWNEKYGLFIELNQSRVHRRYNLHKLTIKAGLLIRNEKQDISSKDHLLNSTNVKDRGSKFMHTILQHLANVYNFSIQVIEIHVNDQDSDDDEELIFKSLREMDINIFITPGEMTMRRMEIADMVMPVWPIRTCFIFRSTSSISSRITEFLRPLTTKVWYSMFILIIFCVFILVIVLKLEDYGDLRDCYGSSVLLIIGAISQQSSIATSNYLSGRIIFLQVMLFSLLTFNYYSASIVSDRLMNVKMKMNDSLITLADSNFQLAIEPDKDTQRLLSQTSNAEMSYFYEKRWQNLPESKKYMSIEEGLKRVARGGFAYHTYADTAYPYIESNFEDRFICELSQIHLRKTTLALWAQRRSPFTKILRIGTIKILNVGLLRRQIKLWTSRKPFCSKNMLVVDAISLEEAAVSFILLIGSCILSAFICIIENVVWWSVCKKYNKIKK